MDTQPKAGIVIITAAHEFQTIRPEDTPDEFIEALEKEVASLPPLSDPRWKPVPEHDYDSIIKRSQDPRLPEL